MQRFRWIALQGNSRGLLPPLLLFCLITTSGIPAHAADDPSACRTPVARIVSIQGSIEVLRTRHNDWSKVARLDTPLCQGDRLRTGVLSRAALFIQSETLVRVDQNTSIAVSQTKEETLVEFTQEDVLPAAAGAYTCGAGYFISRFPRNLRVKTPHLNAAVEGTEFLVAMRCESTELSVFEGKVLAAGAGATVFPAQSISSGQVLTIGGSEPPAIKLLVKPADAVQWVLYYPPLSDATAEADLPPAAQCRSLPKPLDQTCLTQRAETLLRLGRVDEAQREVDEAVALDSGRGDANALRAIISIARNDKAGAIEAATAATSASPNSSRAWLALSYAQQASFKLDDSLVSARKAQGLEPNSSVINARVAELLMSLGRIKDAEIAASAAVDANPTESRAHTVLGFVHLAQINTKAARADFESAIERDSSDPLPRLGLGLAIIRTGKLAEGREQLEIAVALDPTNSLLRSYVGKAYYEENSKERDKLASTQFDLAKELDSNDPTPWFYDAILKQTQNKSVESLQDLQQSISGNDGRAVYRSRLLLDQDRAARLTSLAQAYQDLGFDQLAVATAQTSIIEDPSSYASHRFLADAYEKLPRQELARESEHLQALMFAPIGLVPVSPFRGLTTPFPTSFPRSTVAPSVTPFRSSFNNFEPLYERTGLRLFADALAASQDTFSSQLIVAGAGDNAAFSGGYGHFRSGGFNVNRSLDQESVNLFGQVRASERLSLQGEWVTTRAEQGLVLRDFDPVLRRERQVDNGSTTLRIGGRYEPSAISVVLVSIATQTYNQDLTVSGSTGSVEGNANTEEMQYSLIESNFGLIAGAAYLNGKLRDVDIQETQKFSYDNEYFYGRVSDTAHRIALHVGVSQMRQEIFEIATRTTNPKIGLVISPRAGTRLRFATFKTTRRQLVSNETLEPTQFVGFNQFWDDPSGSSALAYAVGFDHRLDQVTFAGFELMRRDIDVGLFIPPDVFSFRWQNSSARGYIYRTIPSSVDRRILATWSLALSIEYFYEEVRRPEDLTPDGIVVLRTNSVPIAVTLFPDSLLSLRFGATYVKRQGQLQSIPGFGQFDAGDEFWTADAILSYKLPQRRGKLSIGVSNAFDKRYRIIDSNDATLVTPPEEVVFARLSLNF